MAGWTQSVLLERGRCSARSRAGRSRLAAPWSQLNVLCSSSPCPMLTSHLPAAKSGRGCLTFTRAVRQVLLATAPHVPLSDKLLPRRSRVLPENGMAECWVLKFQRVNRKKKQELSSKMKPVVTRCLRDFWSLGTQEPPGGPGWDSALIWQQPWSLPQWPWCQSGSGDPGLPGCCFKYPCWGFAFSEETFNNQNQNVTIIFLMEKRKSCHRAAADDW